MYRLQLEQVNVEEIGDDPFTMAWRSMHFLSALQIRFLHDGLLLYAYHKDVHDIQKCARQYNHPSKRLRLICTDSLTGLEKLFLERLRPSEPLTSNQMISRQY